MTAPSAADLAATVRAGIRIRPDEPTDVMVDLEIRALAALDALLARCQEAERTKFTVTNTDTEARFHRERKRAEAAKARVAELEQALTVLAGWIPNEPDTATAMSNYARAALQSGGNFVGGAGYPLGGSEGGTDG